MVIKELQSIQASHQRRKAELIDAPDSGTKEAVGSNPTLSVEAVVESRKETETVSGSYSSAGRAPAWHAGGQEIECRFDSRPKAPT